MAIYRRGKIWWYSFEFQGRRIQESSGFTNKKRAIDAESVRRTKLLEGRAGLSRPKLVPRFDEAIKQFLEWSKCQHRTKTHQAHKMHCETLKRFFGTKWLDQITPAAVEQFRLARLREERQNADDGSTVAPATVNRALETLR